MARTTGNPPVSLLADAQGCSALALAKAGKPCRASAATGGRSGRLKHPTQPNVRNKRLTAHILLLRARQRSEEHTSELQSLMRISYAVFCLKKKKTQKVYIILTTA